MAFPGYLFLFFGESPISALIRAKQKRVNEVTHERNRKITGRC